MSFSKLAFALFLISIAIIFKSETYFDYWHKGRNIFFIHQIKNDFFLFFFKNITFLLFLRYNIEMERLYEIY
jgi:hypothetical protein